ncbi:DEAD/DEAH box helicase [[Clostridium] polysaccharolyticum]|uniref:ATP-dependent RNA helicase DbpA n=1 Tax=[Clostridium] polysaccharolyticum TaxID=29364 RepID=A0A1H9YQW0_9FIRM|nr:DEAD/DEAH box helicase [[Clostridium] polysaccharolyticum]SES70891.1 ATP-dependent RNA helicase DbpA [[Clostridium] polysaccharolyticum]
MEQNLFSRYGLSKEILEALTMLRYHAPTKVQEQVIPEVLDGNDIVVKSKTGSGKTAAFGVPLCEKVDWDENHPQAIVLEPTRELAVQVSNELFHIGRRKRLKVPAVFGGFPIDKQIRTVKQKSHIVVGTPGRTLDLIGREALKSDKVKYVVIDEADLMFDMGFLDDVKKVLSLLPEKRVTMLFSATIDENVEKLSQNYMKEAKDIYLESKTLTVDQIEQIAYEVENEEKFSCLMDVLVQENPKSCMIFCATRDMVNVLYRQLRKAKVRCCMLHGLVDQKERLRVIEDFREGRFYYLIATEVAARGIDFEEISHVINYDFPTSKESYVHRIGRTGRNGKSGKAISFVRQEDIKMKQSVERYTNVPIQMAEKVRFSDNDSERAEKEKEFRKRQQQKMQPKKSKGAVFQKDITRLSIGGGRKSKLRAGDIVGTICSMEGVTAEDIGIIDVRDSITYVEILNKKGKSVYEQLQEKTIKGKRRKVKMR